MGLDFYDFPPVSVYEVERCQRQVVTNTKVFNVNNAGFKGVAHDIRGPGF